MTTTTTQAVCACSLAERVAEIGDMAERLGLVSVCCGWPPIEDSNAHTPRHGRCSRCKENVELEEAP